MQWILETERLYLRQMTCDDYKDLAEFLQDAEVMTAYEHAFSDEEVQNWLERQLQRYAQDGFGLWAVIRKEDGAFLGDCGITTQAVEDTFEIEIGYHLKKKYWHQGYALEAASACRDYAFSTLQLERICCKVRTSNTASGKVAERLGMHIERTFNVHYYGLDMPHYLYVLNRK